MRCPVPPGGDLARSVRPHPTLDRYYRTEEERLRRCEAPDCRRAFVDLSRNRSRRYCDSRTCGNRLHVAAYRARRKEAAG